MPAVSVRKPSQKTDKFTNTPTEIESHVEILPGQLYFAVLKTNYTTKLKNTIDTLYFTTDDELVYQNYYCDFGPLNVSCLYKYCVKLNRYLSYAKGLKSVVHYTSSHPEKKTNAACLIGSFCVIYLLNQPKDVWRVLQDLGTFKPFQDASQFLCGFNLRVPDVLQAVHKAVTFNFVNFEDFNVAEYDMYDKLKYGDMNWLVPRKFLAFIGPNGNSSGHPPQFYLKYFLRNDVKTVVRLNSAMYDARVFIQAGIQHYDLIYPDGAIPPREVLLHFMTIAEAAPAAVAVHCKAGLGRTGSLIGAYLVKHYHMTAREAIAWMRICRPGSVIGQQQIWLEKIESWLWRIGNQYRVQKYGATDKIPRHRYGVYSKQWQFERDKIIAQARSKLQSSFTKSQCSKLHEGTPSVDSIATKPSKRVSFEPSYKSVSKIMSKIHSVVGPNKEQAQLPRSKYNVGHVPGVVTQGDRLNEKKVWSGGR